MTETLKPTQLVAASPAQHTRKGNRATIISVEALLQLPDVRIPEYQRSYKWTERAVLQLVDDIVTFRHKKAYRFGTIVIHSHEDAAGNRHNDIVDGQQRFTTLSLLVLALHKSIQGNSSYDESIQAKVAVLVQKLGANSIRHSSRVSIRNIHQNFNLLYRSVQVFDNETVLRFLENFEVVLFFINDITEAFQFFDSQNARGKELYPHDLLKAFHLREFNRADLERQTDIVARWEAYPGNQLNVLFSEYLYRIKNWSNNRAARYFSKQDVDLFKGISIEKVEDYPYTRALQIAHHTVDHYNAGFERRIDRQEMTFPFQLDQVIINGRRFFEYVDHYLGKAEAFRKQYFREGNSQDLPTPEKLASWVYRNRYSHRTGEGYLRELFECVVLYYIDKFGSAEIDQFLEKAFVWSYSLRLRFERLGFVSVDNYVRDHNFFGVIKSSLQPAEVLKFSLSLPEADELTQLANNERQSRCDMQIINFFRENRYYEI